MDDSRSHEKGVEEGGDESSTTTSGARLARNCSRVSSCMLSCMLSSSFGVQEKRKSPQTFQKNCEFSWSYTGHRPATWTQLD